MRADNGNKKMAKRILASALAILFAVTGTLAAPTLAYDPTGHYQAENKESRYEVTLCGDGTRLCAQLYWIRPDMISERNKPYLGKYLFDHAELYRPVEWKGKANILGLEVDGRIKVVTENEMLVTACLLILCESYKIMRLSSAEKADEDPAGLAPGL